MNLKMTAISHHNIWAIIPAAGSGRRFSKTELKQYQEILGKTVLEHTVERLVQLELAGYVFAIGKDDTVAQTLEFAKNKFTHFCVGGQERVDSVRHALEYVSQFASDDDWVMVHDAARPCVHLDSLHRLIQHVLTTQRNAILATPVRDTLKRVQDQPKIEHTVSREHLWQAQTPQMARLGELKYAIDQALAEHEIITDEASALEHAGFAVDVVVGRADNIKITYPDDLHLATLILQSQS